MFNPISIAIGSGMNVATGVVKNSAKTSSNTSKKVNDTETYARDNLMKKYRKEIEGLSQYNNVDMGVAFEMLRTNATLGGEYKGGGVAQNWGEIQTDFKNYLTLGNKNISSDKNRDINYVGSGGGAGAGGVIDSIIFGTGGSDTIGVVVAVGVLYMFVSLFRR